MCVTQLLDRSATLSDVDGRRSVLVFLWLPRASLHHSKGEGEVGKKLAANWTLHKASKQQKNPPKLNFTSGNRSERMAVTSSLGFPSHDFVSFIKLSELLATDRLAK